MATQENVALDVYPRIGSGKNAAFKTRSSNLIPAVVYGPKLNKDSKPTGVNVCLDPKNFLLVYGVKGRTTLVDLAIKEGAPGELAGSKVLIKDLQTHTIKREVLHVDIIQLDLTKELRMSVPLKFTGKAKGLIEGGILSIMTRQVEIKCLPTDIPHEIEVDVSDLGVNDSVHMHQLSEKLKASGAKYECIFDSDFTLCAVVPPEEEKVAAPVEGAVAADGTAAPAAAGAAGAAGAAPAAGAKGAAAAPAAAGAKGAAAPAAAADKGKGQKK